MEKMYVHKDRYIVRAVSEPVGDSVKVEKVGLHPQALPKRGRPPAYVAPVPLAELTEIQDEELLAQVSTTA